MFETTQGIVVGRSHAAAGMPCQDAVATAANTHGAVAAIGDGLGSVKGSEIASQAVVTVGVSTCLQGLGSCTPADAVREAFRAAVGALQSDAATLGRPVEQLATTLSIAVVDHTARMLAIGAVGDCLHIVRDRAGALHNVCDLAPSGPANIVEPLRPGSVPRIASLPLDAVDAVLVSSDGFEHLLLRRPADARWPHSDLCHRLLDARPGELDNTLRDPRIRRHTHDDCSVVVIRRRPEPGGTRMQLAGGGTIRVGGVERSGGMRLRRSLDQPGLCLVELPEWADANVAELIADPPDGLWPEDCAWPLVAWPQRIAVHDDGVPGGLVIRHPGPPPAGTAEIRRRAAALRRLIDVLHGHRLAHGALAPGLFVAGGAVNGSGGLTLVNPGPLFSSGHVRERAGRDREWLDRFAA